MNGVQVGLAVFSLTALVMLQSELAIVRRWGSVVGICGQPFWLVAAFTASQWGLFLVSTVYTGVYAWGIYNKFFKR